MTDYRILRAGEARITGGFWGHYMGIMSRKAMPYQWRVISGELNGNPTVRNFQIAAGEAEGQFSGVPYQDTDLAKWIDAAGCALANGPDEALERTADAVIATIVKAQDADGYLDTYYQLVCPDQKWTDPESHELYCFGHMIEAGVSYYEGTGKRDLLEVARRLADHVGRVFGPEDGKLHGYRGHEIIEMALMRLAEATGEAAYRDLAVYFILERRDHPERFYRDDRKEGNPLDYGCWGWGDPERALSSYEHITGHAVRAMYLYSGIADVARETGDAAMRAHCDELFQTLTNSQMYVTGGIGSTAVLEAFTYPYDLPNDTMYAETCASIGLCFFAQRLLRMRNDRAYADAMERCLSNILPAAVAQDGASYFYVNPLEVNDEACRKSPLKTHVKARRQAWYECACCPPNLARLFLSLPRYIYTQSDDRLNVHLYAQSEARVLLAGQQVQVEQRTRYPLDGEVELLVRAPRAARATVALRIPQWCREYAVLLNGERLVGLPQEEGYLLIARDWMGEDSILLQLEMKPTLLQANVRVRENCGKAVFARGPLAYCVEEADNGTLLQDIIVDSQGPLEEVRRSDVDGFGEYPAIRAVGTRSEDEVAAERQLYFARSGLRKEVEVTAVPYFLRGERDPGEMTVWLNAR